MSEGNINPVSAKGLEIIFEDLYPRLCLFANKYLQDMDTSKDVVQEVFIKVWEKKPELKNPNAIKAYFYNAVKNRALDYLKNKKLKILREATPLDLVNIETEGYFYSQITVIETYSKLYKALESLPPRTAKVIQLTLNDYSTNEIAEELSTSPSTVRTQKTATYYKLRKILGQINQLFI